MANVLRSTDMLSGSTTQVRSLRSFWMLRLTVGLVILAGATLFLLGVSWDIQWHSLIGRDRTLIPPHIVMLFGVTLSGLAALTSVLIESVWARRSPSLSSSSTAFAGAFHSSLGAYIAGFSALDAAIAFPLDSYWHSLYGIDVAIWAPFHVMLLVGLGGVALGALYTLLSAVSLAAHVGARGAQRVAYISSIVAFAVMIGLFAILLFNAMGGMGIIDLGLFTVNVYPFLAALLFSWALYAAAIAIPWRFAATSVVGVYLLLALIMELFVPPATNWLVAVEHLTFREDNPGISLVAFEWPLTPILVAIGIDIVVGIARRRNWSFGRLAVALLPALLLACIPSIVFAPLYGLALAYHIGVAGTLVSLLLGLLGAYLGLWFGKHMGTALRQGERI
jgi:hypothetical protein